MHIGFWLGNLRERDHLEDTDIDGKIKKRMDLAKIRWEGVVWTHLAQDRDG